MKTIYTIGYTGWTPLALRAQVLGLQAILIDIRYAPRSKRSEWTPPELQALLGDDYRLMQSLGNKNYQEAAPIELADPEAAVRPIRTELLARPVVLMCACKQPEACHRTVAAEFLAERLGAPVVHIPAGVTVLPNDQISDDERDLYQQLQETRWEAQYSPTMGRWAMRQPEKRWETRPYRKPGEALQAARDLQEAAEKEWQQRLDFCDELRKAA